MSGLCGRRRPERGRPRRAAAILLLPLFLAAGAAAAAETKPVSPEQVARAYLDALKAAKWQDAALIMDPRELKQLHGVVMPVLKKLAARKQRLPSPFAELVAGVTDAAAADRLSPGDVFIRLVSGSLRSLARRGTDFSKGRFTIIGHVQESPDLAHVVYRAEFAVKGLPVQSLSVLSLARYRGRWRVKLDESMRQATALFSRLAKRL